MLVPETDAVLWSSLQRGDPDALSDIYERYSAGLLRYGMTLYRDKELVKDAVQELFLNLWKGRKNLSEPISLNYYLLASFRRILLRKVQLERKREERAAATCEQEYEHAQQDQLIAEEDGQHRRKELQRAIGKLPKRQQEAIFLRFYQELSYEEIAAVMNINYQGVRNIIYKSVKSLRQTIRSSSWVILLAAFLFS